MSGGGRSSITPLRLAAALAVATILAANAGPAAAPRTGTLWPDDAATTGSEHISDLGTSRADAILAAGHPQAKSPRRLGPDGAAKRLVPVSLATAASLWTLTLAGFGVLRLASRRVPRPRRRSSGGVRAPPALRPI